MSSNIDNDANDRTHRLALQCGVESSSLKALVERRVLLAISSDASTEPVSQLAFLTLCNLTARLGPYAPSLYISVPKNSPKLNSPFYPKGNSLAEQASWILQAAMPTEGLERDLANSQLDYDVVISIGNQHLICLKQIRIGWQGWLGIITGDPELKFPLSSDGNPLGALVAVSMAVSRLHGFQLSAVGGKITTYDKDTWALNALTFSDKEEGPLLPSDIAAPLTLLVGAGALASSFVYALGHVPRLQTHIDTIDPDVLKPSNANRQITTPFERTTSQTLPKVDDLASVWKAIRPHSVTYEGFKQKTNQSARNYEIAVTAVDNIEARREVALDLPKVQIDGASGGHMIAVMRGSDPLQACIPCEYVPIKTDEDTLWTQRLGLSLEQISLLKKGDLIFTEDIFQTIRQNGTYPLDEESEAGLRDSGWGFLTKARCGNAKPDRDLPSASVSYVSSLCGFLMASQYLAELLGVPRLAQEHCRWVWDDILQISPSKSDVVAGSLCNECGVRHAMRSNIYHKKWPEPSKAPLSA